jgi:hypothetical protein
MLPDNKLKPHLEEKLSELPDYLISWIARYPRVQDLAITIMHKKFQEKLNKIQNYDRLKTNINTRNLSPNQRQQLNQYKQKLFKHKVNKLVNINNLAPILQSKNSYSNGERRIAYNRIQNLKRKFKNASRTSSYEFKNGIAARLRNVGRSASHGLNTLKNRTRSLFSGFKREQQ